MTDERREYLRVYNALRRAKFRAAGLCIICGTDAEGKSLCEKHMKMQSANTMRYQAKKRGNHEKM